MLFSGMIPVIAADVITTDLSDSFPANTVVKRRRRVAHMSGASVQPDLPHQRNPM